jgi:hypothetical protein
MDSSGSLKQVVDQADFIDSNVDNQIMGGQEPPMQNQSSLLLPQNYKDGIQQAPTNPHDPFLNSMDNIKYSAGIG